MDRPFSNLLAAALAVLLGCTSTRAETFTNPIAEGADPSVVRNGNQYVWCQSHGNRGIALWVSDHLTNLGIRHVIWHAPRNGPNSREVWAPELIHHDGHWYVYFAASDGKNINHRTYVLRSANDDPLSAYTLHGPLPTGEGKDGRSPNIWAIDMTLLVHHDKLYALWSGWDTPDSDRQFLYIAPMSSPTELAGPRIRICPNDTHLWERTEENAASRGLHEGPQVLQHGNRTFLIYSCAASWLPTYKLGLLELTGNKPLDPSSWTKHPEPVFQGSAETYGLGHGSFVQSPDQSEWWNVYHTKRERAHGWRRSIFIQPFKFDDTGFPHFDTPVAPGTTLPRPSGEKHPSPSLPFSSDFRDSSSHRAFSYYGHQQFFSFQKDGAHLGSKPQDPVNDYRSGEKLILTGGNFTEIDATTTLRILDGKRDAGILFRTTNPSVGFDAQQGYFAGVHPGTQSILLGKTDGRTWTELAKAPATIPADQDLTLRVLARGPKLELFLNGKSLLSTTDDTYPSGSVGLRVVNTHAAFKSLSLKTPAP